MTSNKVLLSKSLMDLRQSLQNEIDYKKAESLSQSDTDPAIHLLEGIEEEKFETPELSPTSSLSSDILQYKMPLSFNYHDHTFIFYSNPPKDQLTTFHKQLQKHKTPIIERYGWIPSSKQRINIDLNACLIGIAVDTDSNIMAMITFFDVSDSKTKSYKYEKEISLCVLPKYQRRHLATDLVRLSWNLFADPNDECWIYVMNSTKSGMFWRKFKQWYPSINFRLVLP